jgi:anti-sigma-K factor RskA
MRCARSAVPSMNEESMADADPGPPHADLGGYLLGGLTAAEREAFERHLAGCASCRRELEELRGMPALVGQAAEPVRVPAGMEARVLGAIAREPRPGVLAQVPPRPRRVWAPLAIAAALAIAFVAGLGLGRGPLGGGVQPAPAAQTIRLAAADGSTASGVATVRREAGGTVIELSVRDLPPPPPGHFYTCWLVAGDDTLQHQDRVSVGSFTTGPGGSATVRWETAADLGRYPHLGVTLEPDNGNPLHQGPKVLAASA